MDRPAWQTEELDEEWIEEDSNENENRSGASATRSMSLTEAIGSLDITDQHRRRSDSGASETSQGDAGNSVAAKGTFVVREDMEAAVLGPKTPGKKAGLAGMFTPLALEKMFEPPTPPATSPNHVALRPSPPPSAGLQSTSSRPSPLSQSHLPIPTQVPIVQITPSPSMSFQDPPGLPSPPSESTSSHIPSAVFTFTAPRQFTPSPFADGRGGLAESTPGPSKLTALNLNAQTPHPRLSHKNVGREPPATDPRLRLFQFNYDTFTRDHLSALVDSIAVGSPSSSEFTSQASSTPTGAMLLSRVSEMSPFSQDTDGASLNRVRATKRVKLSMHSESSTPTSSNSSRRTTDSYGEGAGAGAHIARPKGAPPAPGLLQVHAQDSSASRRDYVSESRNLMQQIKAARDFSTVSTVLSALGDAEGSHVVSNARSKAGTASASDVPAPAHSPPTLDPDSNPFGDKRTISSSSYRQQAMNLMAKIRQGSEDELNDPGPTARDYAHLAPTEDVPTSGRVSNTTSGRSSSASTIPGFVFTSRKTQGRQTSAQSQSTAVASDDQADVGRPQQPRKRIRVSTDPDDVTDTIKEREHVKQSARIPSSSTNQSPSPTLSAFPLPPTTHQSFVYTAQSQSRPDEQQPQGDPKAQTAQGSWSGRTGPTYPSDTLRDRAGQDVNRYVSSSTTASTTSTATGATGTTTMTSVGSFIKHPGPVEKAEKPAKAPRAMTQIRPEDVGALPHRIGSMVFDSREKIWHHAKTGQRKDSRVELEDIADGTSDDPFRDIESLQDDRSLARNSRSRSGGMAQQMVYSVQNADGEDDTREIVEYRSRNEHSRSHQFEHMPESRPSANFSNRQPSYTHSHTSGSMLRDGDSRLEIDPASFSVSMSMEDANVGPVIMSAVKHSRVDDDSSDSDDDGDFLEMTESSSTTHDFRNQYQHDPDPSSEVEPVNWRGPLAGGSSFTIEALPPLPPAPALASGLVTAPLTAPPTVPLPALPARDISIIPPSPIIPPTPVIRPAMKSQSVTPMSALKSQSVSRVRYSTPMPNFTPNHPRSVSFSDGRREGQIHGVGRTLDGSMTTLDSDGESEDRSLSALQTGDRSTFVPSARSKRIADMLVLDEDASVLMDSPSKTASSTRSSLHEVQLNGQGSTSRRSSREIQAGSTSRGIISRSNTSLFFPAEPGRKGDATFLTEWSFEVAHDRLVTVITDVQPYKPYWEELDAIELDNKHLEGVARLKEFLPNLDALSMNSNQLTYLTGVPASVRTLSVSRNCLTSSTSFQHLLNLENLDISYNEVDSLQHLSPLRHLRELRADGNQIASVDGLQNLDSLVKLSLQGNRIRRVDFSTLRWPRMEMLNMSDNRLDSVEHLESLPALVALNLDHNAIATLEPEGAMPKLRIVRVSGNKLQRLNGAAFPYVRTLYADNNAIAGLDKANKLAKLENLSLRNQSGKGLKLRIKDVRDVKRLYLSGNPLDGTFLQDACYNLIYLEVAACRLTVLPLNFGSLVPNLRVLNLNYNFLSDLRPLDGLGRLKKLTLIGSRLTTSKALIRCVKSMPDVEMLDFRMNPSTLGWYLPLLVRDAPAALQPSEGRDSRTREHANEERSSHTAWKDLDAKFRKDLPDEAYVGRLVYRGLIMEACPSIKLLDGVAITSKEKDKAARLLESILAKRERAPTPRVEKVGA